MNQDHKSEIPQDPHAFMKEFFDDVGLPEDTNISLDMYTNREMVELMKGNLTQLRLMLNKVPPVGPRYSRRSMLSHVIDEWLLSRGITSTRLTRKER